MNMNAGTKSGTAAVPAETEVSERVEALLERMSLEEKIGQLTQASGAVWTRGSRPKTSSARAGPARCSG